MKAVFADASFLVSAFLGDENGERAWRWWQATALEGGMHIFASFDVSQRKLATAAGLTPVP